MTSTALRGSIVALVTPMNVDGSIAYQKLDELIEWHIQEKTNAILVSGSTGESLSLDDFEWGTIVSRAVSVVNKRVPLLVGTGCNCTTKSVEKTKRALSLGCDACLCVAPFYNKPTQEGIFLHYKTIAESVPNMPIITYNNPGRAACDITVETITKLAAIPNIVAHKEACGSLQRYYELVASVPYGFALLSGDDHLAYQAICMGFVGTISVRANVFPKMVSKMCELALQKNTEAAGKINENLQDFGEKLFISSNPISVKWIMYDMGKIPLGIRLPLTPLEPKHQKELKNAFQAVHAL